MQARWMDNGTGRFISSDPVKDGYNWYSYTAGNPISYVDPTGLNNVIHLIPYDDYDNNSKPPQNVPIPSIVQLLIGPSSGGGCPRAPHSGPCVDDDSNNVEFPHISRSNPTYPGQTALRQGKAKADSESRDAQVNVQRFIDHEQADEVAFTMKVVDVDGTTRIEEVPHYDMNKINNAAKLPGFVKKKYMTPQDYDNYYIQSFDSFTGNKRGYNPTAYFLLYGDLKEDADPTVVGIVTMVAMGFLGVDLPMDIRDLIGSIKNRNVGGALINLVALAPLIGNVKYLKYLDEMALMLKYSDESADVIKQGTEVIQKLKKNADDIKLDDTLLTAKGKMGGEKIIKKSGELYDGKYRQYLERFEELGGEVKIVDGDLVPVGKNKAWEAVFKITEDNKFVIELGRSAHEEAAYHEFLHFVQMKKYNITTHKEFVDALIKHRDALEDEVISNIKRLKKQGEFQILE